MKTVERLIVLFAWGLEIYSLLILMLESLSLVAVLGIVVLHATASALTAFVCSRCLRRIYQTHWLISYTFFFIFALFMPWLGVFGLCMSLLPGLRHSKPTNPASPVRLTSIRPLPAVCPPCSMRSGRTDNASLIDLLHSKNPEKRLKVIFETSKLLDKKAIPLLQVALRDPEDDIRLLAYAMLDRKEQTITERIQHQLEKLNSRSGPMESRSYKLLANDYWELVYLGLAQGATREYALENAKKQILAGLKHYPEDAKLHFQLARVSLRMGHYDAAYSELKKAERLGIDSRQTEPYFAEIAFNRGRYDEVREHMRVVGVLTPHPLLSAIARYWQEITV